MRLVPYKYGSLNGYCVKGYENLNIPSIPFDDLKNNPTEPFELMKSTKSRCTVRFDFICNGRKNRIYVKRYKTWRRLRRIGYLFVKSKARREWLLGFELLNRGINTPLPLVMAEKKNKQFVTENYLVTMSLEPMRPVAEILSEMTDPKQKMDFVRKTAQFIRTVHEQGFYHDDFSLFHVFYDPENPSADFALIDLDNGRLFKKVSNYRRIKNLFQVFRSVNEKAMSLDQRIKFLETYLGRPPEKRILERINSMALRKIGQTVL